MYHLLKLFLSFQLSDCGDNVALVGNGFCEEETNISECNFDGGDCCGPDVSCKWPCFFNWVGSLKCQYFVQCKYC